MERLWEPVVLGRMTLANRLAMAAMTRDRATPSGTPTDLNAQYYAQRASVGLIVSEGTQPSDDGQGYLLTPGIYTDEHIAGWKLVTDRVHAAGGRVFIQLMHVGRVSHPENTPHHRQPVGVEVAAAVAEEIGADRTGLRLSPGNKLNDIVEGATAPLYHALVVELARLHLAYLHIVQEGDDELLRWIRPNWPTSLIVNRPGRPREKIAMDVDAGLADIASVPAFALANPDLVARLKSEAPLNSADRATFFGGGEHGYTDYPSLGG